MSAATGGRRRSPQPVRRPRVVKFFLTDVELVELDEAAGQAGLARGAFAAEVTMAAARGRSAEISAPLREALMELMSAAGLVRRVGTNLNQAVARLNATGQVVPFGAGAHAGTTGPFVILEFPEPTDPQVVYVETLAGDIYLEEATDVDRYTLAFARLLAAAQHPDDSIRLVQQAADTMT